MPRKRTPEEFIELVKARPGYDVLERYIDNSTKIKFRHLCGHEFMMTPGHFLSGRGCPVCAHESRKQKLSNSGKKSFYDALVKMGFELTDPDFMYKNNRSPVSMRCKKCGQVCLKTPGNLVMGHGCKHCSAVACQKPYDVEKKLAEVAPEWELAGEYINAKTPTLFLHRPCGARYEKELQNIITDPGACRFCAAKKLAGTHESFLERTRNKTDYEILSTYVNSSTKIHVRHKKCGHDFWTAPLNFANRKEGCPFCKGKVISQRQTMTHERFLEILGKRGKEFEFLSVYKGAHEPIKVRHRCGYTMTTTPDNLIRKGRCKGCEKSVGEKEVFDFVCGLTSSSVIGNTRKVLPRKKELDIYLPEQHLAIEYNGLLYHSVEWQIGKMDSGKNLKALAEIKNAALWKTRESAKKGIRLVHIFEDEWLSKRDIVEDKIKTLLKIPQIKIFARKTTIRPIASKTASSFYEANHLQGKTKYSVSIGLFNGETLVAVQSYKKGSRKKHQVEGSWELVRYATRLGTVVIGGFSKCLKWFERGYHPREIVSFADLRICDLRENVYEKNGFQKESILPPDYWYVRGVARYHKTAFRKEKFKKKFPKVYSPDKTERQMAEEAKLLRIYDCGKIRYVKTF